MAERRLFGRCHSPRLCGWLCEVSLRATSSAAAPLRGSEEEFEAVAQVCWDGRGAMSGEGSGMFERRKEKDSRGLSGAAGRPSIGGATKVTPELGVGNPLNKEPHNGSSAKRTWSMLWR